jgi:hypothetical protein
MPRVATVNGASVTTPGPEGPGFSLRNESFLVPTLLERVRFPGPTPKSSGASLPSGVGGLVIAADKYSVVVPVPAVNDRVCGTAISSSMTQEGMTRCHG